MLYSELKRLVYLTAGAGGMYCGSCMHDNTLARSLQKRGLDLQLVPVYTPIRTDENDVTVDQVFFGGINIYLQQKIPFFRHLPRILARVFDSPWLIRKLTSKAIATDPRELGGLTVSMLRGTGGNQKKEVLRLTNWLKSNGRPDLLLLSNLLISGGVPLWKKELQVPIVATLQGDDVFLDYLPEPFREQATQAIHDLAQYVDGFIAHTEFYATLMSKRLGLDRSKIFVTPLGIDTSDFESLSAAPNDRPPTIGYLARLAPEKGLHLLVDAFVKLAQRKDSNEPHLLIAGWLSEQHRPYAEAQFAKLRSHGLGKRFEYLGIVSREKKLRMLARCDVFSVPSEFLEPKGLYALEAMAAGVPVILPAHGAFPELLAAANTGWQFPPGDTDALAEALHQVLADEPRRLAAGQRGRQFIFQHRTAEKTAEQTAQVLQQIWRSARR